MLQEAAQEISSDRRGVGFCTRSNEAYRVLRRRNVGGFPVVVSTRSRSSACTPAIACAAASPLIICRRRATAPDRRRHRAASHASHRRASRNPYRVTLTFTCAPDRRRPPAGAGHERRASFAHISSSGEKMSHDVVIDCIHCVMGAVRVRLRHGVAAARASSRCGHEFRLFRARTRERLHLLRHV